MKTKNCPLCNSVAGRWKAGPNKEKLTCWNNNCLLANNSFDDKTWNALPRRDPLQKHKDRVVRVTSDNLDFVIGYEIDDLAEVIEKLNRAKSKLRARHAKK